VTTVHVIPRLPLPPDIEHDDDAAPGEMVTWTTEQHRDDCPLCTEGRCVQKVCASMMGNAVVIHGTRTQ
jgi:hypothetical protein